MDFWTFADKHPIAAFLIIFFTVPVIIGCIAGVLIEIFGGKDETK